MKNLLIKTYLSVMVYLLISGQISATDYYVSTSGNNNSSGTSTGSAWRTIQHAANQVGAGDKVYIQSGTYSEDVSISKSGNANGYISFIGQGNVVMDGQNSLNIAFRNHDASYIRLENITIRDYTEEGIRFAPYEGEPRIHHFRFKDLSIFNTGIINGHRTSNNHGLQIQDTEYFLVDGVYVYDSRGNNILVNRCRYGAVINSEASGTGQRTDDDQDGILVMNSQYIRVANCIANGNPEDGIDIAGYESTGLPIAHVRVYGCTAMNNYGEGFAFSVTETGEFEGYDITFARCLSTGNAAGLTTYENPTDYRIVQNTFVDNRDYAVNLRSPDGAIFKNCIFAFNPRNLSMNQVTPSAVDIDYISWYPTGYPSWPYEPYYRGDNHLGEDPLFSDRNNDDYTLSENSPCIDWGDDLTLTTSSGSGTQISVSDAKYFSDGYYQAPGDIINVGGKTVQIVDIQGNTIRVDRSISWNTGTPVNFAYEGNGPDLGYRESGGSTPPPPPPSSECDLIGNGDFSDNLNQWSDWNCKIELQNGEALVDIATDRAGIKKGNGTLTFEQGKTYQITFDARAQSGRNMKVRATLDYSPYTKYFEEEVTLTTSMQSFEMTFTMEQYSPDSALEFNFYGHKSNVILDNVQVSEVDCGETPPPPLPAECDLIDNGDFSDNVDYWSDWNCEIELQNDEALVDISTDRAGIKKGNGTLTFEQGKTYRINFDARAQSGRNMKVRATLDYAPYTKYFEEEVTLTTSMQSFEMTFTMDQYSPDSALEFNFYGHKSNVILDNVQVTELDCEARYDVHEATSFQATAFPNPFNGQTQLEYELFQDANVQINLYNAMGQLVNTPVSAQVQFAGTHQVYFGENMPSGVYFCELKVDDSSKIIKLIKN